MNQVLLGMSKGIESLGIQEGKNDKTLLRENNNLRVDINKAYNTCFVALPWKDNGGKKGGKHEVHNTRDNNVWVLLCLIGLSRKDLPKW